jgi:hypothetical protein
VRRNAALYTMLAAEVGVVALALFLHLHARPSILRAFGDYGTAVPWSAGVALSSWFLPGAVGFAAVASALALALPLRRSRRAFLIGVGLLVVSSAFMFAVWAFFVPFFQPA